MSALLDDPLLPHKSRAGGGGAPLAVPRGRPRRIGLPQRALAGFATTLSELCGPRETEAFGILMYHRICEPIAGRAQPTWNVSPARFEQQLEGLLRRGFEAWPLREVLAHRRDGRPIPRKAFVITFDDVYENVYLNAYPVLRRLELPATLFLATAYLDSTRPFPSDDWSEAGRGNVPYTTWQPITTDECREMHKSGLIELAAHTHTHADFRGQPHELVADLRKCQRVLRERFGVERATFAFPYGNKNDGFASGELSAAAEEAGMLCALTTEGELVRPGDGPFDWGRFAAEQHDTAATLAAKLNGWHTAVRALGRTMLRRQPRRERGQPYAGDDSETERT
ncbi:MAG: polysaccharide deacetylase family protein [Pirellulaceae bacterium]